MLPTGLGGIGCNLSHEDPWNEIVVLVVPSGIPHDIEASKKGNSLRYHDRGNISTGYLPDQTSRTPVTADYRKSSILARRHYASAIVRALEQVDNIAQAVAVANDRLTNRLITEHRRS